MLLTEYLKLLNNGERSDFVKETVIVLDFGGQYNQLIARRVRECNVYAEVIPYTADIDKIRSYSPKGIIITGGPSNIYDENSPKYDISLFELGVPILGICYGMQLIAYVMGGKVAGGGAQNSEYGHATVSLDTNISIFKNLNKTIECWMSHSNYVEKVPDGFKITGTTSGCPAAAMADEVKKIYGVQFHPEVEHTQNGALIIRNFLYNVCKCMGDWTMSGYVANQIFTLKEKFGNSKVLLALSGGVDSSVCAAMVSKSIGNNLTCIFVDHGLMRKNERAQIEEVFRNQFDVNLVSVDASERFLDKLSGVTDPERKRKIIGEEFIRVFEEEARKLGKIDYLVQGTIYPDVIESGLGNSAKIKSHHNVGGLPDLIDFKDIVEPLRMLFKDEVRKCGAELGLPKELVMRQPFPGPGLAVRVIGEITRDKLDILREADFIFRDEISKAGLEGSINQYFAILTGMRSVGVMGDERTYDYTIALRAVVTNDFMTADWARIPHDVLA
ncbi:MAG: glutamine-hydrolyzing GMP synthase, partial [Clostridiales bacterium]|nr:glutamine-hydrolyzing GMP synthase [Clostridiales bacterium]